jgi:hypothetical protein
VSESQDGRRQWLQWAASVVGEELAEQVAGVALRALERGASPEEAAAAARSFSGRQSAREQRLLEVRQQQLRQALWELDQLPRTTEREAVRAALMAKMELLSPRGVESPPAAQRLPAPGPSWREFLAERSIQILAYTGAFLLAVATLLFDLSGSGSSRFAAVLALEVVFCAGAAVSLRRRSLRPVAQAYIALAALLLPLLVLAAYVFLELGSQGVSVEATVAIGAGLCAFSYAALARTLRSRAYATIGLLALAVCLGAIGAANDWHYWTGAWEAGLAAILLAAWAARALPEPFSGPSRWAGYAIAVGGVLWAAVALFDPSLFGGSSLRAAAEPALALALMSAGYGAAALRARGSAWLATLAGILTVLAVMNATQASAPVSALVLFGSGAVLTLSWLPEARARLALGGACEALVLVQGLVVLLLSAAPQPGQSGEQAVIGIATCALLALLCWRSRQAWWLYAAVLASALAWYSGAAFLLPPRPEAGRVELGTVMSPLPVLLAVGALLLRARLASWYARPLQLGAGVLGLGVVALVAGELRLCAELLAAYAAVIYAVAAVEERWWLAAAALLAGALAVAAWLAGAGQPNQQYALAIGSYGALCWASGAVARRHSVKLAPAHRFLGIGLLLLASVSALFIDPAWLLLAGSLLSGLVLLVDARIQGNALEEQGAALAASGAGIALARMAGLNDLQYRAVLPGAALLLTSVRLAGEARIEERVTWARLAAAAGVLVLLGTGALEATRWGQGPDAGRIAWLTLEAALVLVAGVWARSRGFVIGAAGALAWAAVMGITLLSQRVPLSLVFFLVAGVLIMAATTLALLRGRLGEAAGTARSSWSEWV